MFWERAAANRRRTQMLFVLFGGLALAVAWAVQVVLQSWPAALLVLVVAGVLALAAARFSRYLALLALGARPATPGENQVLVNVLEEMALAASLPVPRCVVVDDPAPNAFAAGFGPDAVVGVTTGLLATMNRDELQGVVAHELAHIASEDTKVMSTAFVLASVLTFACEALYFMRHRRRRGDGVERAAAFVVLLLAPLAAKLLTMAIAREREYLADAEAARFTRNPAGLASALRRLAEAPPVQRASAATAHLYIASPLRDERWAKLFATHPPIAERISRLESM